MVLLIRSGGGGIPTIYQALHDPDRAEAAIVRLQHFDLLPANLDLALAEHQFIGHPDRNDKLKDVLAQLDGNYDYIFDRQPTEPRLFRLQWSCCGHTVDCALAMEPYAYKTLDHTRQVIQLIKQSNPLLELKAVVLTMFDRRLTLARSVEAMVRERFGNRVPQAVIPENVSIAEATLDGLPVALYAPKSTGALAYRALAQERYGICREPIGKAR